MVITKIEEGEVPRIAELVEREETGRADYLADHDSSKSSYLLFS